MKASERRQYLGGSDMAAMLGVSSWTSPVELWQEKALGKTKPVTEAQRRMRRRGTKLEPFIRSMVLEKLADEGHDVQLMQCNGRYVDDRYPFLSCEIDFELRVDGEFVTGDAKSVSGYARNKWGQVGTDEMPIEYAAQFMAGLGIHPLKPRRTLVAALRSFDDVDIFWLKRDEETIEAMREKAVRFWQDHVLPRIPPDPRVFADARALFPKTKKSNIEATPEILGGIARLKKISVEAAALKAEEDEIKLQIARHMGTHALLTHGVKNLLSWDDQQTKRFDLAAFRRDHKDWVELYSHVDTSRVMRFAGKR